MTTNHHGEPTMKTPHVISRLRRESDRKVKLQTPPKPRPSNPDLTGIARPGASLMAIYCRNAACQALGVDVVEVFGFPRVKTKDAIRLRAKIIHAMCVGEPGTTFDLSEVGRACALDHSVVRDYVRRCTDPDNRAEIVAERARNSK